MRNDQRWQLKMVYQWLAASASSLHVHFVLVLSFLILPFPIQALPEPSVNLLTPPTLLLSQGRYIQAAEAYHVQANKALSLERQMGTEQMWLTAGLADALAAMSAEKAYDPVAYEYWANSVRYFLMAGSAWGELRSRHQLEYQKVSSLLSVSSSSNSSSGLVTASVSDQLALYTLVEIWQQRLDYFNYQAPDKGLAKKFKTGTSEGNVSHAGTTTGSATTARGSQQLKQYSPRKTIATNTGFAPRTTFAIPINENELTNQETMQVAENLKEKNLSETSKLTESQVDKTTLSLETELSPETTLTPTSVADINDQEINSIITAEKPVTQQLAGAVDNAKQQTSPQGELTSAEKVFDAEPVIIVNPVEQPLQVLTTKDGREVVVHQEEQILSANKHQHSLNESTQVTPTQLNPSQATTEPIQSTSSAQPAPISRGNIGLKSEPKVTSSQRRSFAPVELEDAEKQANTQ